jgi:hypothetical protein
MKISRSQILHGVNTDRFADSLYFDNDKLKKGLYGISIDDEGIKKPVSVLYTIRELIAKIF